MQMTVQEMIAFLSKAIANRAPILIEGAPGVGKSDVVDQARQIAGADLILSHPAVSDPTDAKGLPWIVEGHATFLPFGELERAINASRLTVWFLDDLGQAMPATQTSYMQLLLARCVNNHKLSEHVTFVAATNRRTDKAGVSGVLEPVKSRFRSIVELVPDIDSWTTWALDHAIVPELIAFLRFKPDLLCQFVPSNDLTNSPVPRTWANAADILTWGLQPGTLRKALAGAVGESAAGELLAFMKLYDQLPSIDAIIQTPATAPIPTNAATLHAVASALAYRATKANFANIAAYCDRLMTSHGEFAMFCIRACERRNPDITQTTAYARLVTGAYGQMVSGGIR
jgi:hypothetical protein